MTIIEQSEPAGEFSAFGIRAFTTTRAVGSFGMMTDEPVREVMARWSALRAEVRSGAGGSRFAHATQVHGKRVLVHSPGWEGWLRVEEADGHVVLERGTAVAVTIADCVPVFVGHPSGAIALLHAGWRGTEAGILGQGVDHLTRRGIRASELHLHLGPAICGRCYEVSPDVYQRLTGKTPDKPTPVDLRRLLEKQARAAGIQHISVSQSCTRCDNDRFFSHRAGDAGRQLGVMVADL